MVFFNSYSTWATLGIAFAVLTCSDFAQAQRMPMDPMHTVGVESCAECHEEVVETWERSAHSRSYETLAKSEAANKIAGILGMTSAEIMTSASCVRCHYTQEAFSGVAQTTAAVSCESCHGSADSWIDQHNRKSLSHEARASKAMANGMKHPSSITSVSQSCYECHVIDDEQLVNQAGHPAISKGFEILSWYSGETNHNFLIEKPGKKVKSHSDNLQSIPQNRKRMIYLTGKLLHLSQSLKALSRAQDTPVDRNGKFIKLENGNYSFSVQHAVEVRRLLGEIRNLQTIIGIPQYAKALAVGSGLIFTTGQQREFAAAADQIKALAEDFCKKNDGSKFAEVDSMLAKLKPKFSSKLDTGYSNILAAF